MPVFLLWPSRFANGRAPRSAGRSARKPLLSIFAAAVVLASLLSGAAAFREDLRTAFGVAALRVFPPSDLQQMREVLRRTPSTSPLLLTIDAPSVWEGFLWQRGLYPDRGVVILGAPLSAGRVQGVRERWDFAAAVAIGNPPQDPGFRVHDDLGPASVPPGRVWFGELAR